jgi:hypothetical protein
MGYENSDVENALLKLLKDKEKPLSVSEVLSGLGKSQEEDIRAAVWALCAKGLARLTPDYTLAVQE